MRVAERALKLISDIFVSQSRLLRGEGLRKITGGREGGEGAIVYRIFEVSVQSARAHRNRRRIIWFMIAKTAREMIAWEAIGISWILIGRGNEDEVAADWLVG